MMCSCGVSSLTCVIKHYQNLKRVESELVHSLFKLQRYCSFLAVIKTKFMSSPPVITLDVQLLSEVFLN